MRALRWVAAWVACSVVVGVVAAKTIDRMWAIDENSGIWG